MTATVFPLLVVSTIDENCYFQKFYVAAENSESAYQAYAEVRGRVFAEKVLVLKDEYATARLLAATVAPDAMPRAQFENWLKERGGNIYHEF